MTHNSHRLFVSYVLDVWTITSQEFLKGFQDSHVPYHFISIILKHIEESDISAGRGIPDEISHSFKEIQKSLDFYYKKIHSVHWKTVNQNWLKTFTLLSMIYSIYPLITSMDISIFGDQWFEIMDKCWIITKGNEWKSMIYKYLTNMQTEYELLHIHNESIIPFVSNDSIKTLNYSSNLSIYDTYRLDCDIPFLIPRALNYESCPAIMLWNNYTFWNRFDIRLVPIEVGQKYTDHDWNIKFMTIKHFLNDYILQNHLEHNNFTIAYLAQHELLDQFPILNNHLPQIFNDQQDCQKMIWFGTSKTFTPFHHDSYNNLFFQIVGYKKVYLLPPDASLMPSTDILCKYNTSDIAIPSDDNIITNGGSYIHNLSPGDCLFIPKGWWHCIIAETTSISLSIWYNNK